MYCNKLLGFYVNRRVVAFSRENCIRGASKKCLVPFGNSFFVYCSTLPAKPRASTVENRARTSAVLPSLHLLCRLQIRCFVGLKTAKG